MPPLPQDAGHWHPALVHFPIACFLCAVLIEWIALARREPPFGHATPILLAVGILGGVLAMFSGWQLEDLVKGGFGDEGLAMLDRHEASGIVATSAACAALACGLLSRRGPAIWKRVVYLVMLHVSAGAAGFAGALGGSLVWD